MAQKKVLSGFDLSGQKISNLGDGTAASDAVTKAQLDAIARGLDWKNSVRVATTGPITLSATQTIDSVAVVANDRVLVKDQASSIANGVYIVNAGAWTRATDFDDATEVTAATAIPVEAGTTNGDKVFILTTDGAITIGTTNLTFTQLGGTGSAYVAGNGLDLTGATFDLDIRASRGLTITGGELDIDVATLKSILGIAGSYAVDVPTSATATITHNLGTKDVHVTVFEISTGNEVDVDVVHTSTTVVTLNFATAPSTGQYRVVVTG